VRGTRRIARRGAAQWLRVSWPSRIWLLLVPLLASVAGPDTANASFSFAGTLSAPGNNTARSQVAVAPNGYAVFVWERLADTSGPPWCCARIQVRSRSPEGTLSAVQTLSRSDQNAFAPQVAVDADGDAVIAWSLSDPIAYCCSVVQARARSAEGTLGPVQTLSAPTRNSGGVKVQVDSKGNAVFGWIGGDGTTNCSGSPCSRIHTRMRWASGTLGATRYLSEPGQETTNVQLALAANRDAVFSWAFYPCCSRIQTRTRAANGALSAIQTLSANAVWWELAVGVDAQGNAVFVWSRKFGTTECGGGRCRILMARTRSADGTLSPVQTIAAPGVDVDFYPDVVVDSDGDAVFKWERWDRTTLCGGRECHRIQARGRSAAGVLSPIQTLSPSGQDAGGSAVDGDLAGNSVFVWDRHDGTTDCRGYPCSRIEARSRSAAGALSAAQFLSAPGDDALLPHVGVDPDGGFDPGTADAAAVWERYDGTGTDERCCRRIQAAMQIAPPPS
jgi:hypothetical protein